ncbi:threonine dehydratase [Herbaspirillum sp. CF444]|uniref:threonine ammonia-lyase n=1 Tax=Herbaspirillum sp. CF444 TaxID=1144319 RepID=UPI0002723A11|nr:threonine/serine dehydratase [Herbaspirillum sp. CF444]EJL88251.1 threonine dehydratase [Herbaspirillum sp. CF444]
MADKSFSLQHILEAAQRISPYIVRTPVLNSPQLDEMAGCKVFVKTEGLQKTGSFKIRGALNKLLSLSVAEREKGVITYSAGNHAQGVAAGARILNCPSVVVMPNTAPKIKIENTRWWGAEVVLFDPYRQTREEIAEQIMQERRMTFISPFDDYYVMAGQGTAGLELCEQMEAMDVTPHVLLVNCSGGGLSSGAITAVRSRHPEVDCYVVEPKGGEKMAWSLLSGKPERVPAPLKTIMDGVAGPVAGQRTLDVLLKQQVKALSVNDYEAAQGLKAAFSMLKIVVEPGAAVSLAAILAKKADFSGKNVALISSGANVDASVFASILIDKEYI